MFRELAGNNCFFEECGGRSPFLGQPALPGGLSIPMWMAESAGMERCDTPPQ